MNSFIAFIKLVRWVNLVFIAITQVLFYFLVLPFVYRGNSFGVQPYLSPFLFYLLVFASICIAAAGYIINDYFDLDIDEVNKPDKLIIEKYIKRRWAIVLHVLLSLAGFIISCYIGWRLRNIYIPLFNTLSIATLWFYSTTFKKKILIGNVLISLLTAWVILIITVAEYHFIGGLSNYSFISSRLLKVSFVYGGFAFIISLVREVIKDMEDIDGDTRYDAKTMPIVWGIPASKVYAGVWLVVLIADIAIIQFYVTHLGWWFSALYSLILIVLPLAYIIRKLYEAQTKRDFHYLSKLVKFVMLTGILSMIFFRIYN